MQLHICVNYKKMEIFSWGQEKSHSFTDFENTHWYIWFCMTKFPFVPEWSAEKFSSKNWKEADTLTEKSVFFCLYSQQNHWFLSCPGLLSGLRTGHRVRDSQIRYSVVITRDSVQDALALMVHIEKIPKSKIDVMGFKSPWEDFNYYF